MPDAHELDRFAGSSDDLASAEWVRAAGDQFARGAGALLAMGLAVRVSVVGYGRALRLNVSDSRGWTCGWTVGAHEELLALCGGLLAPGAAEYVLGRLEKPLRRR